MLVTMSRAATPVTLLDWTEGSLICRRTSRALFDQSIRFL